MRVTTMLRKETDGTLFKHQREKTAEPPSPKGVSVGEWDRILEGKKKAAGSLGTNSAGFKLQGKVDVQGLKVDIENRKGSVREGTNDDGTKWRTKYKTPYGYIRDTLGADGDEIDAYVGPNKKAVKAFVVHQKKEDGSHDEDTVMLGYDSKAEAKKDILRHYDNPKYIGGVTEIPMEELKSKLEKADGKKVTKLASRRKPGDVPSRDAPDDSPRAQDRQTVRSTDVVGEFAAPEGKVAFPMGPMLVKISERLTAERALGEQLTSYDGPTREEVGKSPQEKHRLKGVPLQSPIELNDISTSVGQDEKTSSIALEHAVSDVAKRLARNFSQKKLDERFSRSKTAMIEELRRMGAVDDGPLDKLADEVTYSEAEKSLKRLKQLEKSAPGLGEIGRGAAVGSVVMPLSGLAWRAISGPKARVPASLWPGYRPMAATAAQGAVLGSLLPAGRHRLEQEVEKSDLRSYIDAHRQGKLKTQIQKTLNTNA